MNWLNHHKKAIILGASAAVFIAIIFFLASGKNKESMKQTVSTETENTEVKQEAVKDESNETIVIDIKGAVKHLVFMKCEQGTDYPRQLRKPAGPVNKQTKCK